MPVTTQASKFLSEAHKMQDVCFVFREQQSLAQIA